MVRVGPSNLLRGESGLCIRETIIEGTVVACFGAVREFCKEEVGTRTRIGYSFIVRETRGRTLEITPRQDITEKCLAHAINHTCHPDFENCKFVYPGITRDPRGVGQEEEGGVGGRSRLIDPETPHVTRGWVHPLMDGHPHRCSTDFERTLPGGHLARRGVGCPRGPLGT
jgi:hypothetical protein